MAQKAIIGLIDQPMLDEMGRPMQAPQSVNDRHSPNYDNDVASNWLRGMGPKEACGKPSFDYGPSGNRYGKGK